VAKDYDGSFFSRGETVIDQGDEGNLIYSWWNDDR